jgi:hypothetical protein
VAPLSAEVDTAAPAEPVPTATQVAVLQETAANGPTPPGRDCGVHVAQPSAVANTSAAPVLELKFVPKSSHVVAVAQEIEVGGFALLVSVCTVHVVPPSMVVRTASPGTTNAIAAQKDTVGQETPNSPLTLPGSVWAFQFVPPLVVVSTNPALDVVAPTTTQEEADAQETPERLAPLGTVWLDQIVPPSVVATMPVALTFLPVNMLQVASHTVADGHETAVSGPTPLGKVGAVHVVPPLAVARTAPTVVVPLNSDPTAVQSDVVAQDTAARVIEPVETV